MSAGRFLYVPLTPEEARAALAGRLRVTPTTEHAFDARPAYTAPRICKREHPQHVPVLQWVKGAKV
jgi:hypothetical protein